MDVGTGYYIEKTLPKAKEYLEKKIAVINTNAESVAQVGRKLPFPPSRPPSLLPSLPLLLCLLFFPLSYLPSLPLTPLGRPSFPPSGSPSFLSRS